MYDGGEKETTMANLRIFTLRLPAELAAELDAIAKEEDRTLASLVVHILRQYLKARSDQPGRARASKASAGVPDS